VQFWEDSGMNEPKFKVGDLVEKKDGYRFPGVIIMAGTKLDGEWRYVVEASNADFRGMCHIFGGEQLKKRSVQPVLNGRVAA
jgi:hypothetical protein